MIRKYLAGFSIFFAVVAVTLPVANALTLAELRTEIRERVDDVASPKVRMTNKRLNSLINEAQRDITNVTWAVTKSTSITLVSGTTYYSLPTDTIAILRVTREFKPLKETTLFQKDSELSGWETAGGVPTAYFQDPAQTNKIGFVSWPNSSASTGTVRVLYAAQPTDLSAASDEPFNAEDRFVPYHDLIIFYVCYRLFLMDGNQQATVYRQEYESRIMVMRDRIGSKPNYNPGVGGNQGR